MRVYLLEYNKPNIMSLHGVAKNPETGESIDKKLMPGVNEITEEELSVLGGHRMFPKLFPKEKLGNLLFKRLFEPNKRDGKIICEWVDGRGPEDDIKDTGSNSALADMKEHRAISVVRKTLDRDLLLSWVEKEGRENVLQALSAQLETLKMPDAKK